MPDTILTHKEARVGAQRAAILVHQDDLHAYPETPVTPPIVEYPEVGWTTSHDGGVW